MTILVIILAIIAIPFVLALFSKKSYSVERSITINRPKQIVFDYLKHIRNQDYFSKWVMMDPNLKKSFKGTDGTVGFVYAWEGNKKAGKGEQEILGIDNNGKLDIEVRFERPFKGVSKTPFSAEAVSDNQTLVKWGASSTMKYPANVMMLFMNLDKMLGNDIDESLVTLKGILEKG